jgi:nucleotide-binding universal stress UspA family protein
VTPFRRILHPTDFSSASAGAFRLAVDLAKAGRARLVLIHVLSEPAMAFAADVPVPPTVYKELAVRARADARKALDRLVARARQAGVRVTTQIASGPTHARIVAAARRERADVIVMGTHGRTGLARAFLGSVAGRVVATASCPVMTVRGR